MIRSSLPGDLLQRLVAGPGQQLRQYELLLRRLMCALLPRAAAAASMTSSMDLQALVQAAEVVLAMTDWDRWSRAGMEKDHAWCVLHALLRDQACQVAKHYAVLLGSTVPSAGGCSRRLPHPECSRKLLLFSK